MSENKKFNTIVTISDIVGPFGVDHPKQNLINLGTEKAEEVAESGNIDPMEWYARARQLQELITAFAGKMSQYAKDELSKEDQNSITLGNVKLEVSNTGDRYDYEKDPIYKKLSDQLKDRKKLLDLKRTAHEDYETFKDVPEVPVKTFGREIIKATLK